MPDLLSHVFLAYVVTRLLSWRYDWMTGPYVTAGMLGGILPDLGKVGLIISDETVERIFGLPFDWFGFHTLGGVTVSILVGTTLVSRCERWRVFGLLWVGALTHLLADALLKTTTGHSYPILWPLTAYRPPTPGLYLSTDFEPTVATAIAAICVWALTRYRLRRENESSTE